MTSEVPKAYLPLWPFFLADIMFIALAGLVVSFSHRPLLWWEATLLIVSVAGGAVSMMVPFLRRYAVEQAQAQNANLATAVAQIQKMEKVAEQIGAATALWQGVQEHASQTAASAREIADRMNAEIKGFSEFLQKANESEKAHLRLEVDKLRRAESEWLQILIRILDHTFALFQAAVRSKQQSLIEQIGQFQNVCRDASRRVGLVPMVPQPGDSFDARLHETIPGQNAPEDKAAIGEVLATGYSFQGQLIRRAVVSCQPAPTGTQEAETKANDPGSAQGNLI